MDTHEEVLNESGKAAFAKAFAAAQAEFEPVKMDKTATIPGRRDYRYASLGAILAACRPALNKHGIAVTQDVPVIHNDADRAEITAVTRLLYGDYEHISAATSIIAANDSPQSIGSAKTYAKRYSLADTLGVAAGEDDDGHAAQGEQNPVVAAPVRRQGTVKPSSGTQQPPRANVPQTPANGLIAPGKQKFLAQALAKAQIPITVFNAWLEKALGVKFIKDIPESGYQQVIDAVMKRAEDIKAKGAALLAPPRERQPGEDDEELPSTVSAPIQDMPF